MSEFVPYAIKRARKYVFGKSKQYVQTKVKQAVQAVERKATETIKRAAEDIVDKVNTKRQRIMPRRGLIMGGGVKRRGISMNAKRGKRRKSSRSLRKRRSGYNGKSLAKAMRKIALNASQTKRLNSGTGLNASSGDITTINLNTFQTNCFKLTYDLIKDAETGFSGDHFFLKGINIAGMVGNRSNNTRIGVRVMVIKDEVSGFDYTNNDPNTSQNLLWYNRMTGAASAYLQLPEPYKHAPKLVKAQNAKMVWSKSYELDGSAQGESNTGDKAIFKKYIPINREMRIKTINQTKPQCQWWLVVTHYKLDIDQNWSADSPDELPMFSYISTVYYKDP